MTVHRRLWWWLSALMAASGTTDPLAILLEDGTELLAEDGTILDTET